MTDSESFPFGAPRIDPVVAIAAVQEQVNGVELPEWPVFGLAHADAPGWLSGFVGLAPNAEVIRMDYRPPGTDQRVIVESAPIGRPEPLPMPNVPSIFERLRSNDDDGSPLPILATGPEEQEALVDGRLLSIRADMAIDGKPAPGMLYEEGGNRIYWTVTMHINFVDRPSAMIWDQPNAMILVATRGVTLGQVAVERIYDLGPAKRERARVVEEFLRGQPWPPPPYRQ